MIIVQTPLRISFLGGGTDFEDFYINYGGAVLSTTVNKCIYIIVKKRFDDLICVNYSKRETVEKVEHLQHELIREAMHVAGVDKGIEITTLADIPSEGTGLGSSSSVTVGLLHALFSYRGELKTAEALANEACNIEIDVLGKPIGKQDQYIAAYGNMRFTTFSKNGITVEQVMLPPSEKKRLNDNLLLFYTGITRQSSEILFEQKANINRKIDVLIKLSGLAFKAKESILRRDFDQFGEIMHQGWELKKGLNDKISNPRIDELYETARKAGALGGKITGAGGGGFLLLYCPRDKKDAVYKALENYRELPFGFEDDGSKVIFNYRRNG